MCAQLLCAPEPFKGFNAARASAGRSSTPLSDDRSPRAPTKQQQGWHSRRATPTYKLDKDHLLSPRLAYNYSAYLVTPGGEPVTPSSSAACSSFAGWWGTASADADDSPKMSKRARGADLVKRGSLSALAWLEDLSHLPQRSLSADESESHANKDWSDGALKPTFVAHGDFVYNPDDTHDHSNYTVPNNTPYHKRNSSSLSTPDYSPDSAFASSPLFSPPLVASPQTTAPSSPMATKRGSRVTFTIQEEEQDKDGNFLGLDLFGAGLEATNSPRASSSTAAVAAVAGPPKVVDENAEIAAVIAAADSYGIGALFGRMVGLTLGLAGLDDDEDFLLDSDQPINTRTKRAKNASESASVGTEGEPDRVEYNSWSPVAEFSSRHRASARRAAREAEENARQEPEPMIEVTMAEAEQQSARPAKGMVSLDADGLDEIHHKLVQVVLAQRTEQEIASGGIGEAMAVVEEQMANYI